MIKKISGKAIKCILSLVLVVSMLTQCLSVSQNIFADNTVLVEINGYQVNAGLKAFRTLYSLIDPAGITEEVGLIYGLADYVTENEMVVGSTNETVYSYAATSKGLSAVNYSTYAGAKTYVRTMKFIDSLAFYTEKISIRAYAKTVNGAYTYSDISTTSVYEIADMLYQKSGMKDVEGHDYLYENILSKVNTDYQTVKYDPQGAIVTPETMTLEEVVTTEESTTLSPLSGPENADWSSAAYLLGTTEEQYKVIVARGSVSEIVNVQTPGFATAPGIYISFSDADFGEITVNGKPMSYDVQGAGLLAHVSNFTETYSTVVVNDGNRTEKAVLYVYNAKSGLVETTVNMETPTEQKTTVAQETTSKQEEITTKEPETEEPTTIPPQNVELDYLYDRIDVASSSTTGTSKENSANLFDGNVNTKMYSGDATPIRIAWQMKQAVVVKKYTLTTANDSAQYSYRNPVKWQLYGSNDATSWTQIDTVTNGGMGAVNYTPYTYETDVQDSYQYFLLQVESNGGGYYGFQLAEISMFGDVAMATTKIGKDLNQYFESLDTNNTTFNGYNNEVPENMFDDNNSTKMFSGESIPGSVAWKLNREVTVYSYSLTTANDNASFPGRNPKSWILYGSTDGSNWIQIDKVSDSGMKDVNYTTYTYTVDKVGTYKYFKLNITALYGNSFQLSEIKLYGTAVSPSAYDILLTGDWDQVTSEGYVDELIKLFYNSYPRLYARWGNGSEPTTITFRADSTYDGVAYCAGTTVCVSTAYANSHPNDIGFFSHEITHSVQQYGSKLNYGDDIAWWTENMANYGGFRYFHWSNPRYVQVYAASDTSLQDWGYEPYGNNKWFFAYMDAKYPTTKNADGTLNYGLIDSINRLIKANNTGSAYTDNPYDTTTPFNNVVKQITGYDCIESLRLKYVQELQNGTWTFTGFGNYTDNWITENIEGVANPEYPMLGEKIHGSTTATQLSSAVTSGINLCSGASVFDCSGYTNDNEQPSFLIDGNLGTKWCATSGSLTNPTYTLNGVKHWIMIDLGSEKTFNTYTMYNTQSKEGYGNATEWEILTSNDAKNWTSVDYQSYNNSAISSFNIGSRTARYVFIKVFTPDNGYGTLRLYEFQLYNK